MDLSRLTVDETAEFVSQKLGLPALADMFKEEDVDGSVLLMLETKTIKQFLPFVTMGQCLKLFDRLKAYQATLSEESLTPVPIATSTRFPPASEVATTTSPSRQPLTDAPPSPSRAASPPPAPAPSSPAQSITSQPQLSSENSPCKPLPKEFPIEKLLITAPGVLMINTGDVTVSGKTAISNALVALMQQYSTSAGYVDRAVKHMAATALVYKYPKLKMGMSINDAVSCWHRILTQKLVNFRKRGKVDDPKMEEMRQKYKRTESNQVSDNGQKKRANTAIPRLTEEETDEQEHLKQTLKTEMTKPNRSRNIRLLDTETRNSFPLRRRSILLEAPHVKDVIRDWPALKVESIMLNEFSLVNPDVNVFATFNNKLEAILPQLVDEARGKATAYTKSHPLSKLVNCIPWIENTDPNFDTDLNLIGALAGLAYVLPTTTKKDGEAHRYVVDICGVNSTQEEIRQSVADRHQPFVMVFGTARQTEKLMVYVDKVPVIACSSVAKALYVMLAYYYVLNVEYSTHVNTVLEFLQIACLGLPSKRPQTRVRELLRKLKIEF